MTARSRHADLGFLAAVALVLALPGLGALYDLDPTPPLTERRSPEAWPTLRELQEAPETWPRSFERAFQDRFGFRNALVRTHRYLWLRGLGVSRAGTVVVGKDGWLFMRGELLRELLGERLPWSPEDVAQATRIYDARRRWLAAQGARYLPVPMAEKALIHPEKLPWRAARRLPASARWERMLLAFEQAGVPAVDLMSTFRQAATTKPMFYRTDMHWNGDGNMLAVRELDRVFRGAVGLPPRSTAPPYKVVRGAPHPGMLLAQDLGATDLFREPQCSFEPHGAPPAVELLEEERVGSLTYRRRFRSRRSWARGRALVLADSFVAPFRRFLAENFAESTFVTLRWNLLPAELIQEVRPDVVIHVWWGERFLQPVADEDLPELGGDT